MCNKGYIIMQMKFSKDCDYRHSTDCGIDKNSSSYKPKYVGPIIIGPVSPMDDEYERSCQFIINKNQNSRGRRYDIVYYLVPREKMPKTDPELIKEFYSRSTQEEYMQDFFNSNQYIKALKSSGVLSKCKKPKDLDNCIHTKFCYLEPYDYSMLGFPCLDIDALEDMEASIGNIAINIFVADFDTNLEELEDGMNKDDLNKLKAKIEDLTNAVSDIQDHIKEIKTEIDEDGFYIKKKGKRNGRKS